ncbi:MAG TPA: HAMP domain-containing protein, partial [Nitrospirota bacterium]|nr:HAMP domain-containing protein [Nitrospirota bacterium]
MDADAKKERTGLRGVLYLFILVLLSAGVILLQLHFGGFVGPLSDNILIFTLVLANFLLLSAVIFMTARSLWKLSVERKRGELGAKFRTKLVAAFVSLAFIPTILLFLIGSGLFTKSIERLFSIRVEHSARDAAFLAQAYYDRLKTQALAFGKQISRQMTDDRLLDRFEKPVLKEYLAKKAVEYGLGAVELFTAPRERVVTAVTDQFPNRTFTSAPGDLTAKAFAAEEATVVSDLGRKGEIVRAVVPLYARGGDKIVAAVTVNYYVPQSLAVKTNEIRMGYSEYRSSFSKKEPIKLAYRLGFLSVTLALLLAAIWVALRVAAGITVPIRKLAEGTVAVAAGNLDYRIDEKSGDEVGMLVDSFNKMTGDLKNSREQLEQEVVYKETILSNIDTGVVSMDRMGRITTVNPAAARILGIHAQDVLGKMYDDAFSFIVLDPIRNLFRRLGQARGRAEEVLPLAVRGRTLTLRMRVSTLRDSGGMMSVITFDDLTALLRAQKAETWQDVARKIAHEVKNPLTPIKLSAERLRKKFAEGAKDFDTVFDECSGTIVREVDGLKRLLDEFSEFARMPRSAPVPQPLAPVMENVVQLYAGAHKDIEFVKDTMSDIPEVLIDREQMKRVFINLIVNAVEVMRGKGTIWMSAHLTSDETVRVEVADDGPGIAAEDLSR